MTAPMKANGSAYARIFRAVGAIPEGRVASYGEVAARAGLPGRARQVGSALRELGDGDGSVPWHRVVNASGRISLAGDAGVEQRRRLLREGVIFDARGRIDLGQFGLGVATARRDAIVVKASRPRTPRRSR
jgi:methylated-DNA-protein-cysteine methyltransferase related protein